MNHVTFKYAIVVFTAVVLGAPSLWIALRPSRPQSRLGMRGKKRQRALLRYPTWATIEPLVRWMGARVSGILSEKKVKQHDDLLTHAGDWLGITADEYFGATVAGAIVGAIIGLVGLPLGYWFMPFVGAAGLGALPYLLADNEKMERLRTINRNLPAAIDLLALSMSAGLDFPGALKQLVERSKLPEAMCDELEYMLQQIQLGRTRAAVLKELAIRAPIEAVSQLAQSIIQAEERGNPVASVLEIQAATSRTRRSNVAEKAANDMKARMVLPTMMLIGVGLMLIALPSAMMMERFSNGLSH